MKRLSIVSFAVIALFFTSCGSNGGEKTENKSSNNDAKETVAEPQSNKSKGGTVIHLTKETFLELVWDFEKNPDEWVYEGDLPCMIDFYADWCKPCRMVAPIMEELAEKYKGKIYVYKIDTQKERELAQVFQVTSIPRVLFCPKNEKPQMSVGALPKTTFVEAIEGVLLKNK